LKKRQSYKRVILQLNYTDIYFGALKLVNSTLQTFAMLHATIISHQHGRNTAVGLQSFKDGH